MSAVAVYPAQVVEVNGSTTPLPPGPASSFKYTLDVTMNDATRRITGVTPLSERWPDSYDVNHIAIGKVVLVYRVADKLGMVWSELPATGTCP